MDKNLFTILKELKNIQPNAEYSKHSRNLILLSNKEQLKPKFAYAGFFNGWLNDFVKFHKISATAASFGILTILALIIVSYLPGNKNGLVAKANEMNSSIQIRLDEIKYQLNNSPISTSTALAAQDSLNKATENLLKAFEISSNNTKLEEVVNNIKTAQDIIAKLNSQLKSGN